MKQLLRFLPVLLYFAICAQGVSAQNGVITGTVISSGDRLPLVGVSVSVVNSTVGTVSNDVGHFAIEAAVGSELEFSFIGFKTLRHKVVSFAPLSIELSMDGRVLDEVVAVGYGTMKRSDLTGAISSVKADALQKTPAAGLDQALQGRAAGVTINANSGQPGQTAEIRIRGIGTINNSSPIYVVDGIIVDDIKFVSSSDIESIEILKDASSSAIYGARAANGVILLSTKKGKPGPATVSLNAWVGTQNRWNKLDLMQSKELAETIVKLERVNSQINYYNTRGFDQWLKAYRLGKSPYYPTNLTYSEVETDWQDAVFNKNALIQNYSLQVNGGTNAAAYAVSASYFTQEGTIIGSNYQRLTIRATGSLQVRKWLKLGENITMMNATERNAMHNSSSPGASVLAAALAMAPWDPTHYPDGTVNVDGEDLSGRISAGSNNKNVTNPFIMLEHSHPDRRTERYVGDVFMELTPVRGLLMRSALSMDLSNARNREFKDAYRYSDYNPSDKNFLTASMARYCRMMWENTVTYSREIRKHNFTVLAGQSVEEYNENSISGSGAKILDPKPTHWYLSYTTEDRTEAGEGVSRERRFSLFSRVHYSYNNRYLLTANFRTDGSSKFPENTFGYFPSVAGAWRISEESWMQDIPNLNDLKLRFGWGQIGNDQIGNNTFQQTIHDNNPTFVGYPFGDPQALALGAAVLTFANTGGKWETTEQMNIGVDFSIFNNFVSGSLELYRRDTKDMILPIPAPAHTGPRYSSSDNVGKVRNQGIELTVNLQHTVRKVSWSVNGNISILSNELVALNGGTSIFNDNGTIIDEGFPLYAFYGYEYEGIYDSDSEAIQHLYYYASNPAALPKHAGDARFKDQNKDGKIDLTDRVYIGNPFPWLSYGLNLGVEAYGFDLQIFLQGVYGNSIYNNLRKDLEGKGTGTTLSTAMRNVWTLENLSGDIPNPYGSSENFAVSTRFVEDGAYLRLKNVQLGYSLPRKWLSKATINRCRLYVTAANLLTITGYTGYDPEVGGGVDYSNYPQSRTVTFGVNLDF
ncbi:MAG: TonB-dependent receptor [Prevotellaceae bacterium]|jgi:TonB-linked SusC/RagA family outer membrane protein|nr:TonB-dependent receptor [Prevotellaceae bacterium]